MRVIRPRLVCRCLLALCVLIFFYYGFILGHFVSSTSAFSSLWLSKRPVVIQGGEDADPEVRIKRDHVKSMMKHAWDGYVQYAWGANELKPISRKPHINSIYGSAPLGATIVDSLDTLFIMGMMDEFNAAKDWVDNDMNLDMADAELSLFEVNIRLVGGLLSAFSLTGDKLFRERALQVGERLLSAFDGVSAGIPNGRINLSANKSSGGWPVLAEWGTLSLEFNYLSDVTGSDVFRSHIRRIYEETINLMVSMDGLYPVNIRMRQNKTGDFDDRVHWNNFDKYTLGAAGDSFYEYLLKSWLQSGKTDETSLSLYLHSVDGVFNKLVRTSEKSKLTYLVEIEHESVQHVMGHLTCFAGGMFALGGKTLNQERQFKLGADLTSTCHQSYVRSPTKLGPETFEFNDQLEAELDRSSGAKYYILRPEVIESYFILWRLTHDPRYRRWGWEAVEAIEKNCRISTGGYSGLHNVANVLPTHDDVQQSFFMAETLKYLYLLFSDDSLIDLDQWVFNTEAHPLPIKGGANPLYRPAEAK